MVFSGFNVPFNIFNQSILNFRQEVGGKIDGTWQNDEKIMGYHRDLDGFWGSQFLKLAGQGRFTSQQSKIEELAPKYCCSTNRKKKLPNRAGKFPYVVDFPRKHMPFLMGISQPGWINRGVWQLIPGGFNDDGHPLLMPGLWPLTCPKWHGCRSSLWTISHFNLVEGGTTKKNQRFAYLNPEKTHYMTTWRQTKKSNQCKLQTQKISTTFCASHRPSHLGHGETVNRGPRRLRRLRPSNSAPTRQSWRWPARRPDSTALGTQRSRRALPGAVTSMSMVNEGEALDFWGVGR